MVGIFEASFTVCILCSWNLLHILLPVCPMHSCCEIFYYINEGFVVLINCSFVTISLVQWQVLLNDTTTHYIVHAVLIPISTGCCNIASVVSSLFMHCFCNVTKYNTHMLNLILIRISLSALYILEKK